MTNLPIVDFNKEITLSKEEIRTFLANVEAQMRNCPDQIQVEPRHTFAPGLYAREVTLPKGSLVMGKIHKFPCLTILSKGECTVLCAQDGPMKIKAPAQFVSKPGAKRLVYAHEETVWTTVQATELTDIDAIEKHFVTQDYDEVPQLVAIDGGK
jgi:hypothetical protein